MLAVKSLPQVKLLESLAINKNWKTMVFWRSANLENCQSAYTPQKLSIYHQAQYASHTNQYLIQHLQQHAKSHQPGQLAASNLLRHLLVETVKQDITWYYSHVNELELESTNNDDYGTPGYSVLEATLIYKVPAFPASSEQVLRAFHSVSSSSTVLLLQHQHDPSVVEGSHP